MPDEITLAEYRALRYYGFRPLEALELALKGWAGGMRDA